MKKKNIFVFFMLVAFACFPLLVEAGNIHKKYVNIGGDNQNASTSDIPSNYAQIETMMNSLSYNYISQSKSHGSVKGTGQRDTNGNLLFNGSDTYVEVPEYTDLKMQRTMTIAVKFKVDSFKNGTMPLVYKGIRCCHNRNYSVWVGSGGYVNMQTGMNPSAVHSISTPTNSIQLGKWYTYVGVIDRNAGTMKAYLNGALVATGSVTVADSNMVTSHLQIGGYGNGYEPTTTGVSPFHGQIGYVQLWNKSLSDKEILNIFNNRVKGTEPNLMGYWKFSK